MAEALWEVCRLQRLPSDVLGLKGLDPLTEFRLAVVVLNVRNRGRARAMEEATEKAKSEAKHRR